MWNRAWDFSLKCLQITVSFLANQASFAVMSESHFVRATQGLAAHEMLSTFWAPFMVRWMHGAKGVELRVLLQMLMVFLLVGWAACSAIIWRDPTTSWVSAVALGLLLTIYTAYKRLFQILNTHLISREQIRSAFSTGLALTFGELLILMTAWLVVGKQVGIPFRYGVLGAIALVVVLGLMKVRGLPLSEVGGSFRPTELISQNLENKWLLSHNIALGAAPFLLKVPLAGVFGSHASIAVFLFFVSMAQLFSGVLLSFCEFARPPLFRWAETGGSLPYRHLLGFVLLVVGSSTVYSTLGFEVIRRLGTSADLDPAHDWLWAACGVWAATTGLTYLLDTILIARKQYRQMALCTLGALLTMIACVPLADSVPLVTLLSFPVARLALLILDVKRQLSRLRECAAQ